MAKVNIDSLEPNSHKYKEEKAKIADKSKDREKKTPIVDKSSLVSTKKPLSKKIIETFIGDDIRDVKTWLIKDKIIPGVKHIILDTASMMFFGEVMDRYNDYRGGYRYEKTNYGGYYKNSPRNNERRSTNRNNYKSDDRVDVRNIVVRNRQDAENILEEMIGRIRTNGSVSVAELLDMIDVSSQYTDNNWGWTDDRQIGIRRVSNGFLIDVSEPRYLD